MVERLGVGEPPRSFLSVYCPPWVSCFPPPFWLQLEGALFLSVFCSVLCWSKTGCFECKATRQPHGTERRDRHHPETAGHCRVAHGRRWIPTALQSGPTGDQYTGARPPTRGGAGGARWVAHSGRGPGGRGGRASSDQKPRMAPDPSHPAGHSFGVRDGVGDGVSRASGGFRDDRTGQVRSSRRSTLDPGEEEGSGVRGGERCRLPAGKCDRPAEP